jgi:integrase
MGRIAVQHVDTNHVLKVIEPLWAAKKVETGSRVRGRIEMILDWAKVRGYRSGDNPARWRSHLKLTLPNRSKVRRVRHQPALPYAELPEFMKDLRTMEGTSARALEFTILCAARTSAVIGAAPSEFDLVAKLWTVQPERTGAKITEDEPTPRRVPLSDPAIAVLRALAHDANYMFTGRYPGTGLSNMAMLEMLRDLRPGYTVHGFRSTFKDWTMETTSFPNEVSEAALWHVVEDKTEAAYARGDLLAKRRQLMKAWADYCLRDIVAADKVVPMRRA